MVVRIEAKGPIHKRAPMQFREGAALFSITTVLYIVIAWINVFRLQIAWNDAASRSWAAFSVLAGYQAPKLANIGFIWPPLPTMLQVPLMALPDMTYYGFAGDVLTCLMSGLVVVYLAALMRRLGLPRGTRWALALAYLINPYIIMFGTSGMSEPVMLVILIASMFYLIRWHQEQRLTDLIALGIVASLATMVRFEAWPYTLAIFFAVAIVAGGTGCKRWSQFESTFIIYLVPVVYVLAAFMFWKYEITGTLDLTGGVYSQGNYVGQAVMQAAGTVQSAFLYGVVAATELFPLYLPLIALAFYAYARRPERPLLCLIGLTTAFPVIEVTLIFMQFSFGWLRFFVYVIPGAIVLLAYWLGRVRTSSAIVAPWKWNLVVVGAVVGILLSNVATAATLASGRTGIENETDEMVAWVTGIPENSLGAEEQVASYVNDHVRGRSVLIDDFIGAKIILLSDHANLFIDTRDSDFQYDLAHPVGHVKYILVPVPDYVNQLDAVNRRYPKFFENGAPFATLVREFDGPRVGPWTVAIRFGNPREGTPLIHVIWMHSMGWRQRWRLYQVRQPSAEPAVASGGPSRFDVR